MSEQMKEIVKIAEKLHTQDNRITSHPVFVVEERRYIYGVDLQQYDGWVWHENDEWDEVTDPEQIARLDHADDTLESDVTEGYTKLFRKAYWSFVTACFTEAGCKEFLRINGHNLTEPRVFVYSAHRNKEWQDVRAWLMSQRECEQPLTARDEGGAA